MWKGAYTKFFQFIATPSAELEYVSDRDAGFKQPLESCKLLTRWAFEYFDQTSSAWSSSPSRLPSAELEYVSDRDGGFKQPLESCKLLTRWALKYFDQPGA